MSQLLQWILAIFILLHRRLSAVHDILEYYDYGAELHYGIKVSTTPTYPHDIYLTLFLSNHAYQCRFIPRVDQILLILNGYGIGVILLDNK